MSVQRKPKPDDSVLEHHLATVARIAAGDFKDANFALRQLAQAMLDAADYEIVPAPVEGETTPVESDTPVAAPVAPALAAPADAPA